MVKPIIQAKELLDIYPKEDLVIVDATSGPNARLNYEAKHLASAVWVDLNTQLANILPDLSIGGRHPLPTPDHFSKTLSDLGISPQSHVVVYDDKSGANAAARFWWMLKAAGHDKVQVLNGGVQAAEKINFPMSSKVELISKSKPYPIGKWLLPIAFMEEVEKMAHDNDHMVIDVREPGRYNGEFEPIDLIAGHIPGAVNVPFADNLDHDGLFLSSEKLKEKYGKLFENVNTEKVAVHCGSGVTACHTLLSIAYAGLEIPKLYVGSWSEWSRNGKPIATK